MSRRSRSIIIAASLLATILLICLDHSQISCIRNRPRQDAIGQQSADFRKYHGNVYIVTKVVDGDTIDIDVADNDKKYTRIRLWGVDTPETKHPKISVMYFGPEAADFTGKVTLGKSVQVFLDEGNRSRGKFGRLLAYIKLPDNGFLNEALLSEGFAYADVRFRHSFYHKYQQLQAAARSQKKGLWQKVSREQLPGWLQREKPGLLKRR